MCQLLSTGKFGMVLLRKTLQVEERYPYPVRLEAVYEVIDQAPMRKMEKMRQKGFVQKCKGAGVEGQVEEGAGDSGTTGETHQPLTWFTMEKASHLFFRGCRLF